MASRAVVINVPEKVLLAGKKPSCPSSNPMPGTINSASFVLCLGRIGALGWPMKGYREVGTRVAQSALDADGEHSIPRTALSSEVAR